MTGPGYRRVVDPAGSLLGARSEILVTARSKKIGGGAFVVSSWFGLMSIKPHRRLKCFNWQGCEAERTFPRKVGLNGLGPLLPYLGTIEYLCAAALLRLLRVGHVSTYHVGR